MIFKSSKNLLDLTLMAAIGALTVTRRNLFLLEYKRNCSIVCILGAAASISRVHVFILNVEHVLHFIIDSFGVVLQVRDRVVFYGRQQEC